VLRSRSPLGSAQLPTNCHLEVNTSSLTNAAHEAPHPARRLHGIGESAYEAIRRPIVRLCCICEQQGLKHVRKMRRYFPFGQRALGPKCGAAVRVKIDPTSGYPILLSHYKSRTIPPRVAGHGNRFPSSWSTTGTRYAITIQFRPSVGVGLVCESWADCLSVLYKSSCATFAWPQVTSSHDICYRWFFIGR
jgi:hypothetical protein